MSNSERFCRAEGLVGDMSPLREAKVFVVGIGGVGGYAAEAIVRGGIGSVTFCDGDKVAVSNINRQIVALESTVGMYKAEIMQKRAVDINPDGNFIAENRFLTADNIEEFELESYDYIVDCIDNISAKVALAEYAEKKDIKIISCMSTGNKLDPTAFKTADIFDTKVCPLCRIMRGELRKRGVKKLKVVYSEEEPAVKERTPTSISFVPGSAGLLMAGVVIKDILNP